VLPDQAAKYVPQLEDVLWEFDSALYGKDEFPVRDLPGGDLLNVKVGHVRVRTRGVNTAAVRNWGNELKQALEKAIYRTKLGATT
jgi:hypothetical protein